jgi:hypothetical protein
MGLGAWFLVGVVVALWVGRIFRLMGATSTIVERRWLHLVPDLEATYSGDLDRVSGDRPSVPAAGIPASATAADPV